MSFESKKTVKLAGAVHRPLGSSSGIRSAPLIKKEEAAMSVLVIAEAPGVTAEQDKAIMEALQLEENPPPGVQVRMAGPTENGWRIISLWDSQESFDAFRQERLEPALEKAGRPVAQFEFWPIESVIIR